MTAKFINVLEKKPDGMPTLFFFHYFKIGGDQGTVREALEIQFRQTSPRSEHGLNQDDGQYVTTSFWKPMFSYLREKSLY